MKKPTLFVPPAVHTLLEEDLAEILALLSASFDVAAWSDATPAAAKAAALAAEAEMEGLETSTAIDCPFMAFVVDGEVPAQHATAPEYPSPAHMISGTAYGAIDDYFPGATPQLDAALAALARHGTPKALQVDGGGLGEVRLTGARGADGSTAGVFTVLLE